MYIYINIFIAYEVRKTVSNSSRLCFVFFVSVSLYAFDNCARFSFYFVSFGVRRLARLLALSLAAALAAVGVVVPSYVYPT